MKGRIVIDRDRIIGKINANIYGHLLEHMSRCIYGGIYEENSKFSDKMGLRKDVLDVLRRIKPSIIRWPGGNFASAYQWEDGIGTKEKRVIRYDPVWQVEENNQFGTQEFMSLCQRLDAEPYICVNLGNGSMREAINWVEYCNYDGNSYYARLRRSHGHTEPYRVKYWGLGNEIWSPAQIGYKSASDYAKRAREFAKAMKRVDPGIKLVAVGENDPEWDYEVVRVLGEHIDYISILAYFTPLSREYYKAMAISEVVEDRTKVLKGVIDAGTDSSYNHIKISWDEWNLLGWICHEKHLENDNNSSYNLQNALVTASILNVFQRLCSVVTMACYSPVVNIRGAFFVHPKGVVLRPQYHVFDLYANHSGGIALDPLVESASYECALISELGTFKYLPLPETVRVKYLDVSVTYDRKKLFVAVVNKHKQENITCQIELEKFGSDYSRATVYEINHRNLDAYNDIDCPEEIHIERKELSNLKRSFTYDFPAHSITGIEVQTR